MGEGSEGCRCETGVMRAPSTVSERCRADFGPWFAADAVAFLEHRQDVRGVLAEGTGYPVDIARELSVLARMTVERPLRRMIRYGCL